MAEKQVIQRHKEFSEFNLRVHRGFKTLQVNSSPCSPEISNLEKTITGHAR